MEVSTEIRQGTNHTVAQQNFCSHKVKSETREELCPVTLDIGCGMIHKGKGKEASASWLVDKEKSVFVCVCEKRIIIWPHKMKSCHPSQRGSPGE